MITLLKSVKKVVFGVGRFAKKKAVMLGLGVVALSSVAVTKTAHAALDLTGITVDTAPVFSMAVIVITGLAAIWAIWKTIGIVRSR